MFSAFHPLKPGLILRLASKFGIFFQFHIFCLFLRVLICGFLPLLEKWLLLILGMSLFACFVSTVTVTKQQVKFTCYQQMKQNHVKVITWSSTKSLQNLTFLLFWCLYIVVHVKIWLVLSQVSQVFSNQVCIMEPGILFFSGFC